MTRVAATTVKNGIWYEVLQVEVVRALGPVTVFRTVLGSPGNVFVIAEASSLEAAKKQARDSAASDGARISWRRTFSSSGSLP